MVMGLKIITKSNDGLRYSPVPPEKVLMSSVIRCNDIRRKCLIELVYRERDVFISQGSSAVLYDRLYTASDTYEMYICNECYNPINSHNYCSNCGSVKYNRHIS